MTDSRVLAGRYALGPVIGTGGMGRVHAAHDRVLDRPVAVKVPTERLDAPLRQRLVREARTAARFQHPNAVAVYDVGEEDGRPFVVMELVDGESLAARLRREGALPVDDAMDVLEALLHALEAAHAAGLVHRDVKPANVLLPADGAPKLADFGIAKQVWDDAGSLTMTGAVVGTPAYLAPEQAAGEQPTTASDLYAAGVVAYEMLTGAPPFTGPTPLAVALSQQRDPLPPLAESAPHVPAGVAATVEHALAKDPNERFRSAEEMRLALRAPAPKRAEPARTRRMPVAIGLTAMVVLVVAFLVAARPFVTEDVDPPATGTGVVDADPPTDEPDPSDESEVAAGAVPEASGEAAPPGPDDEGETGSAGDGDSADDTGEPASLRELAALIAADPEAAGKRGDDLLDEVLEIAREDDPEDQREDARELIVDIGKWQSEGELQLDVARTAVDLLEPIGRPEVEELEAVSAAFASLATRARGAGDKYVDVLEELEDLLDEERGRNISRKARRITERLEEWSEQQELDGDVERSLREVLWPLVRDRDR